MIGEERVHPATPRRREEARRRGIVARSADLTRSAALLAAAAGIGLSIEAMVQSISGLMRTSFSSIGSVGSEQTVDLLRSTMTSAIVWMMPILAIVLLAAVAVHGIQTGFAWRAIPFQFGSAPMGGRRMTVTLWSLLKFALLVAIAFWTIHEQTLALSLRGADDASRLGLLLGASLGTLMIRLSLAFLLIGLADYALERRRSENELRMTPQELRDESRQAGGDPALKRERIRRARAALALERE